MKTIRNVLILLLLLLVPAQTLYAYQPYGSDSLSYSNIVVNDMDYYMKVNENHSYDITIKEKVTFNTMMHGIYRTIAKSGTFYREVDGQQTATPYYAIIRNVRVESGQEVNTETNGDAYIIKIGDPDQYVTGQQTYEYSYTYDPGDDGISSFDDVYQNIISQYMENPIEHLSITIDMPKDFDSNNVLFFNGEYGSTESGLIDYKVNGRQITAESTSTINPGTVVTLRVALPDGYFQNINTGRQILPYYYGLAAILLILGAAIYFFMGRGKKPLEPVTFYPPDDMDSAQVAYILEQNVTNEMLVSLLIYFADKGWLTIENLSENPEKPEYIIHKATDIPGERPIFERTIFNALFKKSYDPELKDITNKRFMGMAFINAKDQLKHWFKGKNAIVAPQTYESKGLLIFGIILNSLASMVTLYYLAYREFNLFLIFTSVLILLSVVIGLSSFFFSPGKKSMAKAVAATGLLSLIIAFLTFFMAGNLSVGIVCLVVNITLALLCCLCNKRTEKGNKLYGECKAFRHFIKTAELDRLKLLVEEDPSYYYNILPYAYAMGLTDKWAKNFEGIALNPPDWYYDPYLDMQLFRTIYFMNVFNNGIARNVNHINTQSVRNMGSGGFGSGGFGGGGFGGGGFGGGGAGGMGGGGW